MELLVSRSARALGVSALADANYRLIEAAGASDLKAAKRAILLGAQANPTRKHNPYWFALRSSQGAPSSKSEPMVRLLLDAGADPDSWGAFKLSGSPIHCALEWGQWEAAELLMSRARQPLAPAPEGQSILGSALLSLLDRADTTEGLPAALTRLLRSGADPNEPCLAPAPELLSPMTPFSKNGEPAFLLASFLAGKTGRAEPALALLHEGADPAAQSAKGQGAASFFFLGLQQNPQANAEGLSINPSQLELLASISRAGLPLAFSAILAGFGESPSEPSAGADRIWPVVAALERSIKESREIEALLDDARPSRLARSPEPKARRL